MSDTEKDEWIGKNEDSSEVHRNAVLHHGSSHSFLQQLIVDWRKTLLPCTLYTFKTQYRKQDKIKKKDLNKFIRDTGISHIHLFHLSDSGMTLRVARIPHGPAFHFLVESFTLVRDVLSSQHRSYGTSRSIFTQPPVAILNGFLSSGPSAVEDKRIYLVGEMFRSLFSVSDADDVTKLRTIKRVVLFNRLKNTGCTGDGVLVDVRHFAVISKSATKKQRAVNKLSKGTIPRLLAQKLIQNGESYDDFIKKLGERNMDFTTDTDGDGEIVDLPPNMSFRSYKDRCRIKLAEIGPRLTLRLVRIDEGISEGKVLC